MNGAIWPIGLMMLFCWAICPALSLAQQGEQDRQGEKQERVREDKERMLEYLDPEYGGNYAEQLAHFLEELAARPVNLNTASGESLLQIPGFNLQKAQQVVAYRQQVKPFESVRELLDVPGIGEATLEKVRPYVTVGSGIERARQLFSDGRYWTHGGTFTGYSRYRQTLQPSQGYLISPEEGGYTGSPASYYQRYGYQSNHISLNLTQEKDAGEPLSSPMAFDHTARHVALRDNGALKMLVAGDYSLSFGQGLLLWSGGMFGKGSDVTGAANRKGRGIRPYASAREGSFYRGVAGTVGEKLQLSGFYSRRNHSATVLSPDSTRFPNYSGYHRTLDEQARSGAQRQQLLGVHLQMEMGRGLLGATWYQSSFERFVTAGTGTYGRYDFEGKKHSAAGLDYRLPAGPAVLFGEAARSRNGGLGLISGVESAVGPSSDLSIVYRHYQKDFQSIAGSGFGEGSGTPQNEEGIYLGLRHRVSPAVTLSAYMDQFQFPAPRFGLNQSSRGYEWLVKMDMKLPGDVNFYVLAREETKGAEYEVPDVFGRVRRAMGDNRRSSLRGHLEYRVSNSARLRTRLEMVHSRSVAEKYELGYLLYQDLRLQLSKPLALSMRVTMFDTQSYASRVYQYENDLLYVFSSQPLYNRGQRMYLMFHYQPFRFIDFWGKYGVTIYEDEQIIGTGMNQIMGNSRSEIGFQARVRF